jgi:4-diphosphocytidyl-2-C-methyl-D-erythritol kinase
VKAPAKINLTLDVLGVRPDGYHDLRTTFQSLALHDTLTISAADGRRSNPGGEGVRIECDDPACPTDRTNLVWRAAERVWRASGRRGRATGLVIRIVKRIPMQAGLGGGSSDAAATLRACAALWDVEASELGPLAAELGADVPFFLEGGTALGLDRGDRLFPLLDRPPSWVVLALPPFGVSTRDAYGWWDARSAGAARARRRAADGLSNDLQAPVAAHHPAVARLARALDRAGASSAAMSGSGSAVFGLFASRAGAERAAADLAATPAGCPALVTRTLDRAAYRSLVRLSHPR